MIVRILAEGQWELGEEHLGRLNELDTVVEQAVDAGNEEAFRAGLGALLDVVRRSGTRLEDDSFASSDLILPMSDATIGEVRELLTDEGLVPDSP